MQNLMDKEENGQHVDHLKHEKLFSDVKKYMIRATRFAISKRKMQKPDKEILKSFLPRIEVANHSAALLDICSEGVAILEKYKPS